MAPISSRKTRKKHHSRLAWSRIPRHDSSSLSGVGFALARGRRLRLVFRGSSPGYSGLSTRKLGNHLSDSSLHRPRPFQLQSHVGHRISADWNHRQSAFSRHAAHCLATSRTTSALDGFFLACSSRIDSPPGNTCGNQLLFMHSNTGFILPYRCAWFLYPGY